MKLLLPILFASLSLTGTAQEKRNPEYLEEAISKFNLAFQNGDIQSLSEMITENYIHTNGSWKSFGKTTWLGYMKDRSKKIRNGNLSVKTYEMSESQIEMHGNMAILTAKISTSGLEDGVNFQKSFRVTNVWVYQENRWLRAAFHDTIIEE